MSDNDDPDIEQNKVIIQQAIKLYYTLLDYASQNNWKNLHILAKVSGPKDKDWLSLRWFDAEVLSPLQETLLRTPIVDMENGDRSAILNEKNEGLVYFPYAHDAIVRERIAELSLRLFPDNIPRITDIHIWYEIIWAQCYKQTLLALTKDVDSYMDLNTLAGNLSASTKEAVEWLNSYYDLLNQETKVINEVINDAYSVLPNQYGKFKKRSVLYFDNGIDDSVKNALDILGKNPRKYLRDGDIVTVSKYKEEKEGQIVHHGKKQEQLIDEINQIIQEGKNDKVSDVCDYLISLFEDSPSFPSKRHAIYAFSKTVFPDITPEKSHIERWSASLWVEVDELQILYIVTKVADFENVNAMTTGLSFSNNDATLAWLHDFILFLATEGYEDVLNLKTSAILPNQNHKFCTKDDLFLDAGKIDPTLKDVAKDLGHDFRNELLDIKIFLELPESRTKDASIVAEKINTLIAPKIQEYPRSDETKGTFRKLFLWFTKNKDEAQRLFPELYANKHRLYDDEAIAETMQKAEEFSGLMVEFGIASISDLRKALEAGRARSSLDQRQEEITQEILASLGVTNEAELKVALSDKEIAARFKHPSTPTVHMYRYAKNLIDRAKANIKAHLQAHPDYDCDEMEEVATTVLAGIKKQELSVMVVVRPSDNGEVIVYYASEQDALDYANAELWIENGIDPPRHLTLGKVLKITGINRIPV